MGKEYVEEIACNDVLLTEKGRLKTSSSTAAGGNKQFRRLLQGTFRDHGTRSSTVALALHIVEKMKLHDPPMRLLKFDKDVDKYYQCSGMDACCVIQNEFQALEPSRGKQQIKQKSAATKQKKKLNAKPCRECQNDQNSNPNPQIPTTPIRAKRKTRTLSSPSCLGTAQSIALSPLIQGQDEPEEWHLPENTAILPPLTPTNRAPVHKQTALNFPSMIGIHASKEMKAKWPQDREESMPKVYLENEDCREYDILYRGGRNAEIELVNEDFRICLQQHFQRYLGGKDDPSAQRRFHMSVLYELRQLNPKVRFLKHDRRKGKYYEWNHREAIDQIWKEMKYRRETAKTTSSSSSPPMAATLPQSRDVSDSSRPPSPVPTLEAMDLDESRETQSGRMTPIPHRVATMDSSSTNLPVITPEIAKPASSGSPSNLMVPTLQESLIPPNNQRNGSHQEEEEAVVDPQKSAVPETVLSAPPSNAKQVSTAETAPLAGSEMLPIEIDDDDDDEEDEEADCRNESENDQNQDSSRRRAILPETTNTTSSGPSSGPSAPSLDKPASIKSQDGTKTETASRVGSETLPIEIDDDDNDGNSQKESSTRDHGNNSIDQNGVDTNEGFEEEEWDEEAYQEEMNRAMLMGFEGG